ncbi:MAG TPA: phosphate ABC transporter substrate-binding protein [Rudaea sp.]
MNPQTIKKWLAGALLSAVATGASADVVVVVSAKSDVGNLTNEQVSQIFLAKSTTFPNGTPAVPVDQDEGAAPRNEFYTKVTGKDAAQLKAYWSQLLFSGKAQKPAHAPDNNGVKALIAGKPGAIGYIDKSAVDGSVKVVLAP